MNSLGKNILTVAWSQREGAQQHPTSGHPVCVPKGFHWRNRCFYFPFTDGKINTHVEKHSRTLVLSFSNSAPEGQLLQSGRQELTNWGDFAHRQWESGGGQGKGISPVDCLLYFLKPIQLWSGFHDSVTSQNCHQLGPGRQHSSLWGYTSHSNCNHDNVAGVVLLMMCVSTILSKKTPASPWVRLTWMY